MKEFPALLTPADNTVRPVQRQALHISSNFIAPLFCITHDLNDLKQQVCTHFATVSLQLKIIFKTSDLTVCFVFAPSCRLGLEHGALPASELYITVLRAHNYRISKKITVHTKNQHYGNSSIILAFFLKWLNHYYYKIIT